jgi:aminoglycoside 6'-N-acetyltransferase I
MIDVRIRTLESSDRAEWLRMRLALWPEHSPESHRTEMAIIEADKATAVFVAEGRDGALVGFIEAGLRSHAEGCDTHPVGYVEGWYVETDHRRGGVGRALLSAAQEWARDRGCAEMASDCVLDNHVSMSAHFASGFAETVRLIHFRKSLTPRDQSR